WVRSPSVRCTVSRTRVNESSSRIAPDPIMSTPLSFVASIVNGRLREPRQFDAAFPEHYPAGDLTQARWGCGVRHACWLLTLLMMFVVGCATPQTGSTAGASRQGAPSGQAKRVVTAIRGDPFTIADAINSAGGGRVAG